MSDDFRFFAVIGTILIIMLLNITALVLWDYNAKYQRNFMAYCTGHGDTFETCERLLEEKRR